MNSKKDKFEQLQRFYALWKEGNAMYEDWAKKHGLSSNGVLVLYSLMKQKIIAPRKVFHKIGLFLNKP